MATKTSKKKELTPRIIISGIIGVIIGIVALSLVYEPLTGPSGFQIAIVPFEQAFIIPFVVSPIVGYALGGKYGGFLALVLAAIFMIFLLAVL